MKGEGKGKTIEAPRRCSEDDTTCTERDGANVYYACSMTLLPLPTNNMAHNMALQLQTFMDEWKLEISINLKHQMHQYSLGKIT